MFTAAMKKLSLSVFIKCLLVSCITLSVGSNDVQKDKVVFYAFSGLRWDSASLVEMPSIEKMKKNGVWVKRKINAFQSESLPSFVTMSSGKHPAQHGILSNKMRNDKGEDFDVTKTSTKWWKAFEPIWMANRKVKNASSALCYWPGHDVLLKGVKVDETCSLHDPFKQLLLNNEIHDKVMSFEERSDKVKQWLKMNDTENQPPTFIGVYFEEPHLSMMKHGIHSVETKQALKRVDQIIGNMLTWLKKEKLDERVNFIAAGESGMTELYKHNETFLDELLKTTHDYDVIDNGPITTIDTKDNITTQALLELWRGNKNFYVYSKDEVPQSFRYPSRTRPITLAAKQHWRIYKNRKQLESADGKRSMMGYDGTYASTHALFVAQGPSFKENKQFPAIGNIDVYDILCRALNISSVSNSSIVNEMMRVKEKWYERMIKKVVKKIKESPQYFVLAVVVTAVLFFGAAFLIISAIYKAMGCCCGCKCNKNMMKVKVKVHSPRKLFIRKKKESDEHLLSDSDEISSSDEFYFDRNSK